MGLYATCIQHEIDHLNGVLVHRPHFETQARPDRQEVHQGGETRGGVRSPEAVRYRSTA